MRTLRNNGGFMYFGALSAALHDAVITDPKPYRNCFAETTPFDFTSINVFSIISYPLFI